MFDTNAVRAHGTALLRIALPRFALWVILVAARALLRCLFRPSATTDVHRIDDRTLRDIGISRADLMAGGRLDHARTGRRTR